MRKTKIIGTVGPACDNDDILRHLIAEGMNVCRLNFSHGTHEEHKERIERIKRIREELNAPVPIMLDTKGPEYRIGEFDGRKVTLEDGQKFTFTTDDILGDNTRVSVSYKNLIHDLSVGDTILVNNGLVVCKVDELPEPCHDQRLPVGQRQVGSSVRHRERRGLHRRVLRLHEG